MTQSSRLLLGACLLVIGVGLLYMWSRLPSNPPSPAEHAPNQGGPSGITSAQWQQVIARLEALENQTGRTSPSERLPVERSSPDVGALPEIRARIEKLEAELAALHDQMAAIERVGKVESIRELKSAIRELEANDPVALSDRAKKRIALRTMFLERYPEDAEAARQLERLTEEQLATDPKQALADFERHASRIAMDPWTRDSARANALFFNGRLDDADQLYQQVISSPDTPDRERWGARFNAAYMYMQKGLHDEARRRFEAMIADAANDPAADRSAVGGANSQLQLLKELSKKK